MKKTALGSILFAGALLAISVTLEAQQPHRVYRIVWIAYDGFGPTRPFVTGLRERGYIEEQSVIIDYRSAEGRDERLSEIVAETVRLKPDVILVNDNDSTNAVKKGTKTIPIVFIHGDPIWEGTVGSLAKPENNLTGLSIVSFELAGKRLELLRDAFPKISRVGVVLHANAFHRRQLADMQKVAQALGCRLQALEYKDLMLDLESVFQRAFNQHINAFVVLLTPNAFRHRTRLVDFAAKNRLPAIYPTRSFAEAGGLMSYGVDYAAVHRRAGYFVDRILKGAKPADLPVEQPMELELVINLKTANALGLTIPSNVLMWADSVIK